MLNKKRLKRKAIRLLFYIFVWSGIAIGNYFVFSIFIDSPSESDLKESNRIFNEQYIALSKEYKRLDSILNSIEERDNNIYTQLFEASVQNVNNDDEPISDELLFTKSNNDLAVIFFEKLKALNDYTTKITHSFDTIELNMISKGSNLDNIPAIQPVANKELTKLVTSYGQKIQPFYKTLAPHKGIDYAIPEDTRVFATANGRVSRILKETDEKGIAITIDHGNGYQTTYAHLNKALVRVGQRVKREDIIAHSGNTGMSFMPHLHYEITLKKEKINPINYFFMELNHTELKEINDIAEKTIQSLD